ncbi:uncharacterized protein EAE97_006417 [Botrytis byssoidea]|uniref:Uncharacterized protein n=1 Tax=Botrytis byssoidea TaxID=139641 RepID=A0A9P5M281_9HELO|nr:uncharacterized protein EAE97_006417 [Botrytis byssoidea]KAF7941580.1 hypothetical protein EAE97_006417 [Botrytis byssoidea]
MNRSSFEKSTYKATTPGRMRISVLRTTLCFTFLGKSLGAGARYCKDLNTVGICFDVDLAAGYCRNVDLSVNDQTNSVQNGGGHRKRKLW